jgi:hypothetical protein
MARRSRYIRLAGNLKGWNQPNKRQSEGYTVSIHDHFASVFV